MPTALSASQEDYLEAILALADEGGAARVRDIARRQGVSMPSVTGALKRLGRIALIDHDRYNAVTLTPKGRREAVRVANRHAVLRRFLGKILGVDARTAECDACAIEHHVSAATIRSLERFVQRVEGDDR